MQRFLTQVDSGRWTFRNPASLSRSAVLSPDHSDVATSLNNLAALYRAQAKNQEDKRVLRKLRTLTVEFERTRRLPLGANTPWKREHVTNLAPMDNDPMNQELGSLRSPCPTTRARRREAFERSLRTRSQIIGQSGFDFSHKPESVPIRSPRVCAWARISSSSSDST